MKKSISPEIIDKAKKREKASKEVRIPLYLPEIPAEKSDTKGREKKEKSSIIVIELA